MSENRLDQLTSVAISLKVERKPSFLLVMSRDGTVRRMGYSAISNEEKTVAVTEDPSIFARFVKGLPSDVLDLAGTHEAEGADGELVVCRIELATADETIGYQMTYMSDSAVLARHMQIMVNLGEELTDDWYATNLTLTPVLDLPPVKKSTPATPPAAAWEPPPAYEAPPAYEPPDSEATDTEAPPLPGFESSSAAAWDTGQAPGYQAPEPPEHGAHGDRADEASSATDSSPETDSSDPARAKRPAIRRPAGRPKASHQRFALAVALDVFLISSAYGIVTLILGRALPLGAALFFLFVTEVSLLQFLRKSPGYWLLDMRAAPGAFPTVNPRQIAEESLVTHIVATGFLLLGVVSLTAWVPYQDPIPFFGFGFGQWFTVIWSLLVAGALITTGVFIFRNEILGVWIGAGVTALGFLSVWFARGNALNGWLRLELMRQREAEGRPVFNPLDLDPILGRVIPATCVLALAAGVGLYFVWKRFTYLASAT